MHGGWIIAGLVLAAGLIALLAVAQSRWLQSNTLKKCVVLSVGVHLLLAMLAAVIGSIRPASWGRAEEGRMTMVMVVSDEPVGPIEASTDDRAFSGSRRVRRGERLGRSGGRTGPARRRAAA